jgi:hypothetical protein
MKLGYQKQSFRRYLLESTNKIYAFVDSMEKNLLTFEGNSNIDLRHLHVSRKKVTDVHSGKYISFTEQSWKFDRQMA